MIDAHLVVERPRFRLDVRLRAEPGEVVALLGPNGAGKTTALRVLAGLTAPSGGHVTIDGVPMGARPPERRPIGMVFQDYLLFPHMSALENVAFGPRCHGSGRAEARRAAAAWLERVGLAEHRDARPGNLSGGQAQRVALARALAVRPRLLLLDEPLAALDAHTRMEVRARLRHHLEGFTGACVLVTHDPLDAMVLADRLVVIEHGVLVQEGTPAEVARHPRTGYVARLVGLNLYRGDAEGHEVRVEPSAASGTAPGKGLVLSVSEDLKGPAFVAFPPSAVALYRARPDGTPRNLWPAVIEGVERHGDRVRVHLGGPVAAAADITPAAVAELGLSPGQEVWAAVKATETHAYPAGSA
ncbi:ABC transporter ATP-binding protein [Sphaerisporangium sp. TRM90804]|uniref:ABC transporter ATP-binding protein n=1 Tax=Sphaerisporangium sp. TRM90804 TaxID=3031113 RepID=UPI00244C969C|nr:ABC transporter ATP-binding protein [Sphaerisporangium sp. TRM90804]MDH2426261.1 ABC transporter ATP-binding protein [Sphaerisporangium sp. TRM90804]